MVGKKKIKIGIIGCGTIGAQLAQAIEKRFSEQARLSALCDIDNQKAKMLQERCSSKPAIVSLEELITRCSLIVETASAEISFVVAQKALQQGKDVMIMSVGGILSRAEALYQLAQARRCRIYLPSGALCGLDAVNAASMGKIEKATLITRKPLEGLSDAPFIKENKVDLSRIKAETVVFEGKASEAVKGFPKNVNVCATLSLAGIGAEKTKVKIITSPAYKTNIHEIEVEGDFGKLLARAENVPSPLNPKTSYLACLSAIATLRKILNPVKIGT